MSWNDDPVLNEILVSRLKALHNIQDIILRYGTALDMISTEGDLQRVGSRQTEYMSTIAKLAINPENYFKE